MTRPDGDTGPLRYKRARFVARFPRDRRYAESHFWLRERNGVWRIGFTTFAVRMLGEPVEIDFEVDAGSSIETGQVIGWLEGFKAVTDLYAPIGGRFLGANPLLEQEVERIKSDCYGRGWLYEVDAAGEESGDLFDAEGYARLLDGTIDRMAGDET